MNAAIMDKLRVLFEQMREIEAKLLNLMNEILEREREEVSEEERDSPL